MSSPSTRPTDQRSSAIGGGEGVHGEFGGWCHAVASGGFAHNLTPLVPAEGDVGRGARG